MRTMLTPQLAIAGRQIGGDAPCYVVAELGSNHDGRYATALRLLDAAAEAGADAVKLQLFRAASMYPRTCGVVPTPGGPADFYALLRGLELPESWVGGLWAEAKARGLALICSVFDEATANLASRVGVGALKVASPELTHLPLLRHLAAQKELPVLVSTGMATPAEVQEAAGILGWGGTEPSRCVVLHCVSAYPAPPGECQLGCLPLLRGLVGTPVGWSDHTVDPVAAPLVARHCGAAVVEKHLTLDRTLAGPDHPYALEPREFARMVQALRVYDSRAPEGRGAWLRRRLGAVTIGVLQGPGQKQPQPSEQGLRRYDRRCLRAARAIAAGELLAPTDVAILRGERNLRPGLHPRELERVVGARTVRPIGEGEGIVWGDLEGGETWLPGEED